MSRHKNSHKQAERLRNSEKKYNSSMFEFLKKPSDTGQNNEHSIPIESIEEPHGEDVGQIAVDVLETQEGYIIIAPLA